MAKARPSRRQRAVSGVDTQETGAPVRGPGRPPRSDAERAAQRARLLDGAMAAVRRVGPDVSVDEMAAEAGVSKPVLYSAFGGKDGIADAIALELADRAERTLIAALATAGPLDLDRAARTAIDILIGIVVDDPQIYEFLVRSIRASDQGLLDNALVRSLHERVGTLTRLVAPTVDPALVSVLTHGAFGFAFASVESWQRAREPSQEELVDALARVVVQGFRSIGQIVERGG